MSNANEKIDLIELLRKIVRFISRHKWILLSSLIIGLAVGFFYTKNNPDKYKSYYRSQFSIQSPLITNDVLFSIVDNFSHNFKAKDSINTSAKVINIINNINTAEEVNIDTKQSKIKITIETKEPIEIEQLIDLVEVKVKSNESFKAKYDIENKQQEQLLRLINSQLGLLQTNENPEQFLASIKLLEKKQEIEKKIISLKDPIQSLPIEPHNYLVKQRNIKFLNIIGYGLLFMAIGIGYIVFRKLFKLAKP